jgi:uracil-DNA glycosylase
MPRPNPPPAWAELPFFGGGEHSQFAELWNALDADPRPWQPNGDTVFRALALTAPDQVRVVIVAQDPYSTDGRATGLAFSFPNGQPPRDSLCNIYAELFDDLGILRGDGDLTGWAQQGVLLMNRVLTVPIGKPNGHAALGWKSLSNQVIDKVCQGQPKAFLLWGGNARQIRNRIGDGHLVLETSHPSPRSVNRGFSGSRPFSQTNNWLEQNGKAPIAWGE